MNRCVTYCCRSLVAPGQPFTGLVIPVRTRHLPGQLPVKLLNVSKNTFQWSRVLELPHVGPISVGYRSQHPDADINTDHRRGGVDALKVWTECFAVEHGDDALALRLENQREELQAPAVQQSYECTGVLERPADAKYRHVDRPVIRAELHIPDRNTEPLPALLTSTGPREVLWLTSDATGLGASPSVHASQRTTKTILNRPRADVRPPALACHSIDSNQIAFGLPQAGQLHHFDARGSRITSDGLVQPGDCPVESYAAGACVTQECFALRRCQI